MVTELVSRAKEDDIRFVSFQFTDIFGTIKSVTLPVVQREGALEESIFFDGSSVQGFARIFESDMILVPDPDRLDGKPDARGSAEAWIKGHRLYPVT